MIGKLRMAACSGGLSSICPQAQMSYKLSREGYGELDMG